MKYCVDYQREFKYLNEVDEITITYNRKDTTLVRFLNAHKDQRVNIYIADEQDFLENDCIRIFDAISAENPNLDICFKLNPYTGPVKEVFNAIVESKVKYKYFFNTHVTNWDTLWGYTRLKPSSIYITEDLGFELDKVSNHLHLFNIEVRCFPNVAQSCWADSAPLYKFFIRPEDEPYYSKYVDVYEFYGPTNRNSTYYEIYAKDKKWLGKLKEIIIDFDSDLDSRYLLPTFAERRVKCGKRCLRGAGCNICNATAQLSEQLEKDNLVFTFEK
jgi:hypothetical protein